MSNEIYQFDYQNINSKHNPLAWELQGKRQDEGNKIDEKPSKLLDYGWNEFGRVDIIGQEEDEVLYAYINSRTPAWMHRFDGDLEKIQLKHKNALVAFPMIIRQPKEVLSIGSGAGYDTLFALSFGADHIDSVEINPLLVKVVQRWKDFSGQIYNNKKVRLFIEEGRNFVRRQSKKYDLIYLSLVQTTISEIYEMALTENYVYTIEAFREYMHHLNPNGMIAIWVHDDGLMARTVLTGLEAFKKEGVDYPNNTEHIAVLTSTNQNKDYSYLILISQTPFTLKEEDKIIVPYSRPEWLPSDQEVKNVQNLREAEILLRKRIDSKEHPDILPVYDNRPFFFNVHGLYPTVLNSLTFKVALGLVFLMGVSFVSGFKPLKNETTKWRKYIGWPAYFAFLGIGFMLIEVTLMQRFLLWLGSPI